MIAEVVLNNISRFTDNLYHYIIPDSIDVKVGFRVIVPFGKGNKKYEAYVLDIVSESEFSNLKEIEKCVDNFSYFGENMSKLIKFMHFRYFSPYCDIIKAILPRGVATKFTTYVSLLDCDESVIKNAVKRSLLKERIVKVLSESEKMLEISEISTLVGKSGIITAVKSLEKSGIVKLTQKETENIREKTVKYASLIIERSEAYAIIEKIERRMPARARLLELLCENDRIMVSELLEVANTSLETLKAVSEYVSITEESSDEPLFYEEEFEDVNDSRLTNEQKNASDAIKNGGDGDVFLIHGVTGSGKTRIYLDVIEDALKKGKQAIFLVPEISLTPQMIKQVTERFGKNVALMHSRLTMRQRYNEWQRMKKGEANIVVGARSAVFAPFENLGIIICDEEHESSYKSETSPRYNTTEIARFRIKHENARLVLGSATPLTESYYNAKCGKYKLIELKNRINKNSLPSCEIVDMRKEMENGNRSIFSERLKEEIKKNLDDKKQTILFLNKRGYSSFVSCRSCGFVPKCPNCNISLTYHKAGDYLVCHYCDYRHENYSECPKCSSKYIKHFGIGTQKVYDEIKKLFPDASVIRMDADTTVGRESHEMILKKFSEEKTDILIGTQMIAKGLDFPFVTLVGILSADMSLNFDDFRSGEKTFSLITQVAGRAGRSKDPGRAIIQTYYPDDEILIISKNQDYKSFYESEIETRKNMVYPPFCEMINITSVSQNDKKACDALKKLRNDFIALLKDDNYNGYIKIYTVSKSPMHKINGRYRYRFIIKLSYKKKAYELLHKAAENNYNKDVSITVDTNPVNMY